jgi:hypothetical protein
MMSRKIALAACVVTLMACGASRGSIVGGDGNEGVPVDGQDFIFDTPFDAPDTPGEIPTPDIVIDQPDVPLDFLPDDTPYTDEDGDTIRDEDEGNGTPCRIPGTMTATGTASPTPSRPATTTP